MARTKKTETAAKAVEALAHEVKVPVNSVHKALDCDAEGTFSNCITSPAPLAVRIASIHFININVCNETGRSKISKTGNA